MAKESTDSARWVTLAVILILILGALELTGILALLPQCSFSFNFWFVTGCSSPITIFGFNPNLVAGAVGLAAGTILLIVTERGQKS